MDRIILQEHLTRFEKKLKLYLKKNTTEPALDAESISKRSRWAANAYVGALSAGNPKGYCEQIANEILFEGIEQPA